MKPIHKPALLKGAIINGGVQYFFLKDHEFIPISVDSITNNDKRY